MGVYVPKSDTTYYDPLTGSGLSLLSGELASLRLYECGTLVMDSRWNYTSVCSPFWRAYHNLEVGASVRVQGEQWALGPDQMVILPEGLTYDCVGCPGVRHLWIHFSVGVSLAGGHQVRPWVVKLDRLGRAGWAKLHAEVGAGVKEQAFTLRHRCAGLLWQAWAEMVEEAGSTEGTPRLRAFLEWLERRIERPPGIQAMAVAAGLEKRAFLRWFRRETGRTPADYMTERRIHEACRRLRFTAESIEQVAERTGFANRHHFSRVFRERTGRTPASYRER